MNFYILKTWAFISFLFLNSLFTTICTLDNTAFNVYVEGSFRNKKQVEKIDFSDVPQEGKYQKYCSKNLCVEYSINRSYESDTTRVLMANQELIVEHQNQWLNAPVEYVINSLDEMKIEIKILYLGNSISGKIFVVSQNDNTLNLCEVYTFTTGKDGSEEIYYNLFYKKSSKFYKIKD